MIERAKSGDIPRVLELLTQVNMVHHNGRPDLFRGPTTKYSAEELETLFRDSRRPVFVYRGGTGEILGYAFCVLNEVRGDRLLQDIRTLYIDDLCVDSGARGRHIGKTLYDCALQEAARRGCDRVTLHAWNFNREAFGFYEKLGMTPLYTTMEQKLNG